MQEVKEGDGRERYLAGGAKHFDTSSCSAPRLWLITACVCVRERDEAALTSRLAYRRSTDGPSHVCVCVCLSQGKCVYTDCVK